MNLEQQIKKYALEAGFDLAGIASAEPIAAEYSQAFKDWLEKGYAAEMDYMRKNLDKRLDPQKLLEGAKSIIVIGLAYKRELEIERKTDCGTVANYGMYQDYHGFIKERLYKLAEFIKTIVRENFEFKVCVDTVPIAERAIAERAGLGFIAKSHMLINDEFGPEILLAELVTTLKLEPDRPIKKDCGICDKCIKACPTGALRKDGFFDASRCISYLTIEYKGQIDQNIASRIGGRLFGCDMCFAVCPRGHRAKCAVNKDIEYYPQMAQLDLNEILDMNENQFREKFADSPLQRAGLKKLQDTAKIILENMKNDKC